MISEKNKTILNDLPVERIVISEKTADLLTEEFGLMNMSKKNLQSLRNQIVRFYDSKRNDLVDGGRLNLDDMTRMSMVTGLIDNFMISRIGE